MSKYFDGYASFDYKEMSKEKLITELKEKVRYIGEIKRNNNEEIAKVQSARDKTIADLEAKLAESEEYNQMLLEEKGGYIDLVSGYSKKCKNYEQQLAEKEKEIAYMTKQAKKFNNEAQKYFEEVCCKENNQDKISFCIEQLEKVRDSVLDFSNGYWKHFVKNGKEYMMSSDLESCLEEYIDNQIEELKKGE